MYITLCASCQLLMWYGRRQFAVQIQSYLLCKGRDNRPLRGSPGRCPAFQPFEDVLPQPALYQPEYLPVADRGFDPCHKGGVWDAVKVAFQVGIHHMGVARLEQPVNFPQRVLAPPPRTEPVAGLQLWNSKIGSITSLTAACAIRSLTVGIPKGRVWPSPFGISTRLTAWGRYVPPRSSSASSAR